MDEHKTRRRGPRRRYSPQAEAEQAKLAQELADSGATWSEVIAAFASHGWVMSQTLLQRRFAEWGIERGW